MSNKLRLEANSVATFKKDDEKRTFKMTGYAGSVMNSGMGNIVIDLAGMKFRNEVTPIFQHHDSTKIVGHATPEVVDGKLELNGVISGTSEYAEEVVSTSDNGFPWQASVGISIFDVKQVDKEDEIEVNGEMLAGPVVVLSDTELFETSFVPLGRDSQTSAVVLSEDFDLEQFQTKPKGEMEMEEKHTEAPVVEKASLSDLRAALNDDTAACEAFEAGLSVVEAKAQGFDKAKEQVVELAAQLEATLAAAENAKGADPVAHVEEKLEAEVELSVEEQRQAKLAEYADDGIEGIAAFEKLAKEHEELCI